jgi:hypothetical protein
LPISRTNPEPISPTPRYEIRDPKAVREIPIGDEGPVLHICGTGLLNLREVERIEVEE